MLYTAKPYTIQAAQWDGSTEKYLEIKGLLPEFAISFDKGDLSIKGEYIELELAYGNWLVVGMYGELLSYPDECFHTLFHEDLEVH